MSSTSHEVCEMWNGQQLVRIMGSLEVKELLHISSYQDYTHVGRCNNERKDCEYQR